MQRPRDLNQDGGASWAWTAGLQSQVRDQTAWTTNIEEAPNVERDECPGSIAGSNLKWWLVEAFPAFSLPDRESS